MLPSRGTRAGLPTGWSASRRGGVTGEFRDPPPPVPASALTTREVGPGCARRGTRARRNARRQTAVPTVPDVSPPCRPHLYTSSVADVSSDVRGRLLGCRWRRLRVWPVLAPASPCHPPRASLPHTSLGPAGLPEPRTLSGLNPSGSPSRRVRVGGRGSTGNSTGTRDPDVRAEWVGPRLPCYSRHSSRPVRALGT